jgi:glycosyltransferase involved in cell wall biosynthesis
MAIALVTNYLPPYRVPLYSLLSERLGVEVFCFGGEAHYVPEGLRDLDRQLAAAPFPAQRLGHQREAARLARSHAAVVASTTGRVALPAAYAGSRRARRPFVLWASLWRHPRTAAHIASFPMMRRLYRRADAIVTYGDHVSRYVAEYRGRNDDVFAAPQAVEPELFGRAVSQEEVAAWRRQHSLGEGHVVLFAGRLEPDKGIGPLLEAWRALPQRAEATLCVVGDGPLTARVADAGEGVKLVGRMPREQLPVAYEAAVALVVPSIATRRFAEPWGLVCNEAMMRGTPVLATTAVGAAAGGLVRDGQTGLVVRAGDAGALAAAMGRLLADDALRGGLGARARAAVAEYTYERAADAFERALAAAGVGGAG